MLRPSTESSPWRVVAQEIGDAAREWSAAGVIIRKSEREIEKIAAAGSLVAETIAHVGALRSRRA